MRHSAWVRLLFSAVLVLATGCADSSMVLQGKMDGMQQPEFDHSASHGHSRGRGNRGGYQRGRGGGRGRGTGGHFRGHYSGGAIPG